MQWLKMLLAALVVVAAVTLGLFAVVVVAVGFAAYFVGRLLLGRTGRLPLRRAPPPPARPTPAGDVIEVTATEIPADRLSK
jgi:hypothetical protein